MIDGKFWFVKIKNIIPYGTRPTGIVQLYSKRGNSRFHRPAA
jgi:hypothetical protein